MDMERGKQNACPQELRFGFPCGGLCAALRDGRYRGGDEQHCRGRESYKRHRAVCKKQFGIKRPLKPDAQKCAGGGTGNLTVACDTVNGSPSRNGLIRVWPNRDGWLKIENVNLHVSGENNCLQGPNVIVDQATITVEPSQYGTPDDSVIYADSDVTIRNGSVVTGTIENAMWGICANNGDLTISDSTVKLTETVNEPAGLLDWGCYALEGHNHIFVTNSNIEVQTEMTEAATSRGGTSNICGMLTFDGNLSIIGSKVKISQDNRSPDKDGFASGIATAGGGTISITQNSEVTVSALNSAPIGVQAGGTLEVDGSVVISTATSSRQNDQAIEFYYDSNLVLKDVAVVEGTWDANEHIITFDPASLTGGRSVIRPISTDVSLASVTLGTANGRISDAEIAIELPTGSTLPMDGAAFAIVPTDGNATVGTPVTADGGATWTFAVTAEDGVTSRNYTIHVTVTPVTYAVQASAGEGGTVTGAGIYAQGASVTVTAVPNSGYAFVKWMENGLDVSTDASYTFSAAGERNLVAVFERKTAEPTAKPTATVKPTAGPTAAAKPPKTGDNASLGLWMAGLVASLAGLSVLLRKRTIKQK